jgi:biotin operon repressor
MGREHFKAALKSMPDDPRAFSAAKWRYMDAVMIAQDLTSTDKVVASRIVSKYIGAEHGYAWPSEPTLANELGMGERTVRRSIATLAETGWLVKLDGGGRKTGGGGRSNGYTIDWKSFSADTRPPESGLSENDDSDQNTRPPVAKNPATSGQNTRPPVASNIAHIKNPVKNPSTSALACAREASPPPANSNEGLEASRLTVVQRLGGQAVVDAWRGRHGIGLYLWQNIADNLAGAHGLHDPIPTNAVATAARQTTDAMNAYFEMTIRDLDREGRLSEIEGIVSEHDLACFKSYGTIEIEGEDQDRLLERLHELGRL